MSFEVASDSGSDGDEDPPGGDGDESGDDDGDSDGNGEDDGMRHTDVACDPETNHFNRQRVLPDDYVTASPESEQASPNPPDVERACRKRRRSRSQPICRTGGTDLQAGRSTASGCISGEMVKPGEVAKDPGEDEEADRKQAAHYAAVSLGARPKSHFSSRAVKARSLPPAVDKPGITFKSVEAAEEKTGPYEDGPAKKSTSATSHNDEEEEPTRPSNLKAQPATRLVATVPATQAHNPVRLYHQHHSGETSSSDEYDTAEATIAEVGLALGNALVAAAFGATAAVADEPPSVNDAFMALMQGGLQDISAALATDTPH